MSPENRGFRMNKRVIGWVCGCLCSLPVLAGPDVQGPPVSSSAGSSATLDTIVVTGSYIRRTNTESPSPVTTINADEISKSGLNSIADVIRTVYADHSGTL